MEKKSSSSTPENSEPSFWIGRKKPFIWGILALGLVGGFIVSMGLYFKSSPPEPLPVASLPLVQKAQDLPPGSASSPLDPSEEIRAAFKALKIWLQMKEALETGQSIDGLLGSLQMLLPHVPSEIWMHLSESPSVYVLPSPFSFLESPFVDKLWARLFSIRWGSLRASQEALWNLFDFLPDTCKQPML